MWYRCRSPAVGAREGVEVEVLLIAPEASGATGPRPHARDLPDGLALLQELQDPAERAHPFAADDEIDLGLEEVDRLEGGVVAPGHGRAAGSQLLHPPADVEGAQHVHRVARDTGHVRAERTQRLVQPAGMKAEIEEPDVVSVEPGARAHVLQRDRLGDGAQIARPDDVLPRVRVDEQDAHQELSGGTQNQRDARLGAHATSPPSGSQRRAGSRPPEPG